MGSVRAVAALRFDAVLSMKLIHRVESSAQSTPRDNDVYVVGKFLLGPRCS